MNVNVRVRVCVVVEMCIVLVWVFLHGSLGDVLPGIHPLFRVYTNYILSVITPSWLFCSHTYIYIYFEVRSAGWYGGRWKIHDVEKENEKEKEKGVRPKRTKKENQNVKTTIVNILSWLPLCIAFHPGYQHSYSQCPKKPSLTFHKLVFSPFFSLKKNTFLSYVPFLFLSFPFIFYFFYFFFFLLTEWNYLKKNFQNN